MRPTIILLALLLLTSCSNNRYSEFKGNIESISEKTYSCSEKFGDIIKGNLIEGRSYHFKDNNISELVLYNDEGERTYSYETEFKHGKPILRKIKRRDFAPDTYETIQVEETESLISRDSRNEVWLRTQNSGNDTIYCELDKHGYLCLQKEKDTKGNTITSEFKRDKNKNIIESIYSVNNEVDNTTKSEFDENNFQTASIYENLKYEWKEATAYKYKTDETGNWIERIAYINNTPKSITIREIEYKK
ncbi:hypothetical protein [Bacteroides sp.]